MSDPKSIQGNDEQYPIHCPFCGKDDFIWYFDQRYGENARRVMCMSCNALGPLGKFSADAVQRWNNRKEGIDV
jgi:Lar family restriction alleviation protein